MIKRILLIGGTMGVGKTTICQSLKHKINHSVFLDGDWCWDSHPFIVNDETKTIVMDNIIDLLQRFIDSKTYQTIIFCWVMHDQAIVDEILKRLNTYHHYVYPISLICNQETLIQHLQYDIDHKKRQQDIIERSLQRLPQYNQLNTIKLDVSNKSVDTISDEIISFITTNK